MSLLGWKSCYSLWLSSMNALFLNCTCHSQNGCYVGHHRTVANSKVFWCFKTAVCGWIGRWKSTVVVADSPETENDEKVMLNTYMPASLIGKKVSASCFFRIKSLTWICHRLFHCSAYLPDLFQDENATACWSLNTHFDCFEWHFWMSSVFCGTGNLNFEKIRETETAP